MSNTIKCKDCRHYDQQYKFAKGHKLPVWYGWCRKTSEYPALKPGEDGGIEDVRRVEEGSLAKPVIVGGASVIPACLYAEKK